MDSIGFAVVGSTGVIGRVHIDAINNVDGARLIGVSAVRPGPLRQQAEELGVKPYTSLEELLDDPEVDVITIATPHPSHESIALSAFASGKHVLTEKPMAATVSEAESMVKAARTSGMTLGVLFNQRFRPEVRKMHELIKKGVLGDIYRTLLVHASLRTQDYYDRRPWRGTWDEEGGGVLINQAIHPLDLLQWLGGMPRTVTAAVRTLKHTIEVEDFASALLEYENGGQGMVHCNTVQSPDQLRLEFWGERGGLILSDRSLTLHRLDVPVSKFIDTDKTIAFASPPSQEEIFSLGPGRNGHEAVIDDFVHALLEGREPAITGEEGVKSQELVAAITLSGCRGSTVQLPLDRQVYDSLLKELKGLRRLPNSP